MMLAAAMDWLLFGRVLIAGLIAVGLMIFGLWIAGGFDDE